MSMIGTSGKRQRILRSEEAALAVSFHGMVGGVNFDFRHPTLAPVSHWKCPPILTSEPLAHPGFHIAGELDSREELLAGTTIGALARADLAAARERGMDILFPGDRVVVSSVDLIELKSADDLTLEFDRHAARLHLNVIRTTGDKEPLTSLLMLPRGSMAVAFSDFATMSLLGERTDGLSSTNTPGASEVSELLKQTRKLQNTVNELLSKRETKLEEFEGLDSFLFYTDPTFDIYHLVNLAALYGYRQGRLEADLKMKPLARQKLAHQVQARSAGQGNRDPKRESFAVQHKAEFPGATVASATKEFMALHPHEDASSVRRSFGRHFPLNRKEK